jgi:hypothetical protein
MSYRLFLDDIREPWQAGNYMYPVDIRKEYRLYEWVIVRNYDEFVDTISEKGVPSYISFDHDLEADQYIVPEESEEMNLYYQIKDRAMTGYDCAKWLVEYCEKNGIPLPICYVHSANPVGADNIRFVLKLNSQ